MILCIAEYVNVGGAYIQVKLIRTPVEGYRTPLLTGCVSVCLCASSADGKYEVTYKPNVVLFYTGDVT